MSKETIVWLVGVNIVAWLVIHLGVAYAGTRLPSSWFDPATGLYRERRWERAGRFYDRVFRVRTWKGWLPEGAALFRGGFRKAALQRRDEVYMTDFVRETCRAELVHLVVWGSSPLFFLWNPAWAGLVMVFYATLANLPCIIAQRYNRIRLLRVLARQH